MKKRILYAEADYATMVREHGYFVDKTSYIAELERVKNPVFLRPRRFGKSLLCRMLECYYNIRQAGEFAELFEHTWIGQNPTPLHNSCSSCTWIFPLWRPATWPGWRRALTTSVT